MAEAWQRRSGPTGDRAFWGWSAGRQAMLLNGKDPYPKP